MSKVRFNIYEIYYKYVLTASQISNFKWIEGGKMEKIQV